jgi:hypothetical protein
MAAADRQLGDFLLSTHISIYLVPDLWNMRGVDIRRTFTCNFMHCDARDWPLGPMKK